MKFNTDMHVCIYIQDPSPSTNLKSSKTLQDREWQMAIETSALYHIDRYRNRNEIVMILGEWNRMKQDEIHHLDSLIVLLHTWKEQEV